MGVDKKKSKFKKILLGFLVVAVFVFIACGVYLSDYYHADGEAIEAFIVEKPVEMQMAENGNLVWEPEHASAGFLFYPGGKVEHTAYIPLMEKMASEGVLCVLVEMPFRLAVFDMDATEGIQAQYPGIEEWYIGGHSLGGSMAASYLEKGTEPFDGLILLGSYSTADLSGMDLEVLSIYGSEDQVLNRESYEENKGNLPVGFEEIVIEGGCHAYFGMYGAQDGDGMPGITNEEQIEKTADAILENMKRAEL